jgi:5-methylcytosine-specific restriction endonuclease McrA
MCDAVPTLFRVTADAHAVLLRSGGISARSCRKSGGHSMGVSRHYRAIPEGEVPVWIWNASKQEWMCVAAVGARYGARRYNPAGRVRAAQRKRILERDGYRCQWPGGCRWPHLLLTIDHIVPVSHGGSKRDENLQVLCTRHNHEKEQLELR